MGDALMETIPLFPLTTVLLPHGRMPLQIFEPRYLDLVSRCLKHNTGFGVVWLRQGSEVYRPDRQVDSRLAQIGTYARIVDWDSLANGLLGITIEGSRKFRLISSRQQSDHLHMAEVEWIEPEPCLVLPEHDREMADLLVQLLAHPHVLRLKFEPQQNDVSILGCLLTQLLPIAESIKFELLALTDPELRLQQLVEVLDQIGQ
jgi:Lon protease-like protein